MLILYSDLLLFQSPGFESRPAQTLIVCNFEALWPVGSKTNFFERSDLYLLGKGKKIGFAALWRHFMLSQNTLKSYHKTQIDRERLKPAVCIWNLIENADILPKGFWPRIANESWSKLLNEHVNSKNFSGKSASFKVHLCQVFNAGKISKKLFRRFT